MESWRVRVGVTTGPFAVVDVDIFPSVTGLAPVVGVVLLIRSCAPIAANCFLVFISSDFGVATSFSYSLHRLAIDPIFVAAFFIFFAEVVNV